MRAFVDETGTEWRIWEVRPEQVLRADHTGIPNEHRDGGERRTVTAPEPIVERRQHDEARRVQAARLTHLVAPEFVRGWLTFESDTARRRLAPVPPGWAQLSDTELAALWRHAAPASLTHLPAESSSAP
jgi:hypothetical protein